MKTEHALDWGKTAAEIEADFEQMAKERDRYREALERISRRVPIIGSTGDYREGQLHALQACAEVATKALRGGEE